jgi:uncharacterized membrane protein
MSYITKEIVKYFFFLVFIISFIGLSVVGIIYAQDKSHYDKYSKEVIIATIQNVNISKVDKKYKYNYQLVYNIDTEQITVDVETVKDISDYYKNGKEIKIRYNLDNKKSFTTYVNNTKEHISYLEILMIVFGTIMGIVILFGISYIGYGLIH